jgi:dGTPase
LAINSLIQDAVQIFLENETAILAGSFQSALLEKSQFKAQIEDIIKLSVKNIYQSKEVIQKEVVGHRAITILLENYTQAAVHKLQGNEHTFDKLLLSLVPEGTPLVSENLYQTLLNVSCFVASLSDGKALRMAQDIGGSNH